MATSTISLQQHNTSSRSKSTTKLNDKFASSSISSSIQSRSSFRSSSVSNLDSIISTQSDKSILTNKSDPSTNPNLKRPLRRHITDEINDDSIYSIYLKKITYTFNNVLKQSLQQPQQQFVTRCDQVDYKNGKWTNNNSFAQQNDDQQQSLQWETRQLRTLKAATIEHLVQYILLLTDEQQQHMSRKKSSHHNNNNNFNNKIKSHQHQQNGRNYDEDADEDDDDDDDNSIFESNNLLEERNNVAHAMHVLFATYRQFVHPWQLFNEIIKQKPFSCTKQFNFILFYWLNNYPEDFWTQCQPPNNSTSPNPNKQNSKGDDDESLYNSSSEYDGSLSSSSTKSSSKLNVNIIDNNNVNDVNNGHHNRMESLSSTSSTATASTTSISSSGLISAGSSGSTNTTMATATITSATFSPLTLADQLISIRNIDEEVKKHCLHLLDMKRENSNSNNNNNNGNHNHQNNQSHHHGNSTFYVNNNNNNISNGGTLSHSNTIHKSISKSSSIIELDTKFVAQQLTAIDLENFLTLKPYSLLSHNRTKTKIEIMIRNFNLLSRHVIVTILQNSTPNIVTNHWIDVAHHLRKMRNFNSLKAIIAGLTNESIYRLKNTVWNKLPRQTIANFTYLSSIVDDVNNQTMLRHTQLFVEGTSKVSLEESFGTVPYLGTFLTDITMINTRYDNFIKLDNGKKLINFEKCSKQYEVLMQMQLLQKNAIAALQQQQNQQQNYHLEPIYSLNHYLSLRSQSVPSIPRVARIFRNWFQLNENDLPNDRECYQISLSIENPSNTNTGKNKK